MAGLELHGYFMKVIANPFPAVIANKRGCKREELVAVAQYLIEDVPSARRLRPQSQNAPP